MVEQVFLAACGGLAPEQMDIPEGTATHGKPLPEQRKSVRTAREKPLCTNHNTLLSCIVHCLAAMITRGKEKSGLKE